MSVKIRDKSSKGSQPSKKYEQSSGNGSCATLETDPSQEFKKMRQSLHNLFELAKKEIATLYQVVLNQTNSIGLRIRERRKISQQLVQEMSQIKKKAEQAMLLVPQKLRTLLVSPKFLQRISPESQEMNEYGYQPMRPEHKRTRTSGSIGRNQLSITDIDIGSKNITRKITSTSVKSIENLKFLQTTWPYLECVHLEGKSISSTCHFQKVTADLLQVLNLSNNDVSDLSCFSNCSFPSLTHLNLSKNRVKLLDGLQSAKLPKLAVLNLSKNLISCLKPLTKFSLPDLYELHLEGNRLQSVQFIGNCDFANLEILNLDSNKLKHLNDLSQITFYRLKCLSFSNNSVSSLQFMSSMSLRRLQGLIAHNNKIRELQPLTKGSFPAMKQIILHNNEITDISCIKRMDFPQLSGFDLEFNKIQRFSIGCFVANDRGYRDAKKKYPFILI